MNGFQNDFIYTTQQFFSVGLIRFQISSVVLVCDVIVVDDIELNDVEVEFIAIVKTDVVDENLHSKKAI